MRKNQLSLAACALLALAGIGYSGSSMAKKPVITVPDLPAGAYVVSVGSADNLTVGKYYADAHGQRLLVLNDGNERANALYLRKNSGAKWSALPKPTENVTVSFLQEHAIVTGAVDIASVTGSYQTRLMNGDAASFAITASGDITAGSSSCKLNGKVEAGTLPGTLKLKLKAAHCGSLPATSRGVLIVDRDYAPAAFRLVSDDCSQLVDLWAFTD